PLARIGCRKLRGRGQGRHLRGRRVLVHAHDQRVRSAVEEVMVDGGRHGAVGPEASENALVFGEAEDAHGALLVAVDRPAQRATDEGGDRGRNAGDRANSTGYFLDVDTRIAERDWHRFLLRRCGTCRLMEDSWAG